MNIERLENACKWLQRNDRNGDYVDMIQEYNDGELGIETIYEVCERCFIEIRDEHLDPNDTKGQQQMNEWLDYIKG